VDARGSALITSSTPGASTPTQWLFDPCAFIDTDGRPYVYFGGQYPTNARVILLNSNMTSVSGSAMPMFATNFFEASYVHKRGSTYYFTYSTRPEAGMVIYCETNSNPTNGFVAQGTVLPNPPVNVYNNNHQSICNYKGNWYIAYHNRALAIQNGLSDADAVYKRSLCLDRVNYNADGSIQQVTCTTDGLPQLKNLNPYTRVEGETMAQELGIETEVCSEGGMDVTSITNGCWLRVRGVNFSAGASVFYARVASAGSGGNIELHLDSLVGTLLGTCAVSPTGGWQSWTTSSCAVSGASGVHDLYLKFTGGAGNLFSLNWWEFQGAGVSGSATINPTTNYQTIEGLGGATAFYAGWLTAHPYKQEIYSNAFAGLNLSMLRLGNWFRYTNGPDSAAYEIVSNGNRILGHPVPVLISSWAPPAFLKSNGQVGNGGTLIYSNGGFAYPAFANYWYDSLLSYRANGVSPTWISIQNEPDWAAGYDSCVFRPNEGVYNGTNYASYSRALDATFQRLTNLPSPPKLLGPECVGLGYNDVQNYAATMNGNSFYGLTHHLYGGSTDGTPDGYIPAFLALTNVFPGKPRFMTEFGVSDMIEQANLIHNVLTVEQASGYNYWSLVWPGTSGGLIQIEFPWDQSQWTNAPPGTTTQSHGWWITPAYWAMKHYSYFIQPGYRRVAANCNNTNVLASAYLSPDGLRLVAVFINRYPGNSFTAGVNFGSFSYFTSSVYQTAGGDGFLPLGAVRSALILPASSLTTVVLDKYVAVGAATNPSPTNRQADVALDATLNWSPGNNALSHALYLGLSSNAVVQATPASPEFQGMLSTNSFTPVVLAGSATYFWRVDEIAGANTNTGAIWSFSTAPAPALAHRYSFSETTGTTVADSVGGSFWNGALPSGGTFAGGQLTLSSASQQYVSLPSGIAATLSNFTIEVWARLNSTASWNRLFDFGNNTTTYMFLTPQNGSTSRLRFAITTSGGAGEQQINGTSALSAGAWYHVTVAFNGNTGILYVNGVAVGTNNAMTLKPASLGITSNNYLGRSQYPADPYLNGVLDEFRIYSVALSAAEIAATEALGSNQLLSTNSPSVSLTATMSNLTLSWPLASAGFTVQSRTNLVLGGWVNLSSPAPQIIGSQWQVTLPVPTNTPSIFYRLAK
jgi:O-glycosyl hydrolase